MMIFLNKIYNFPHTLPHCIRETIPSNSPITCSTIDYCGDWYTDYNSVSYRTSVFFKAPLLYIDILSKNNNLSSIGTLDLYKKSVKSYLLQVQNAGQEEWLSQKFSLYTIKGLRQSKRLEATTNAVCYN